ncbi:dihydrofolate reductase family protein [Nocardia sp. NPDC006630]|uniref:dihydrofolate reductase family protein n=1 Tax=Nocardia sp. NPDC006630 TaxID=3157181 RepID=UPI0033ABB638
MARVTLWMQMSLDGFAEGADERVHWPVVDEELYSSMLDELRAAEAFLYGRKTYEIMSSFWPTADGDPAISQFYIDFAGCWKAKPKVVFSRSLDRTDWNTKVIRRRAVEEMVALREGTDGHLIVFGGIETAAMFMTHNLIDEYRLFVHPLVLGAGVPLFPPAFDTSELQLASVTAFDSAVVMMHYRRECAGVRPRAQRTLAS